MSYKIKVMRHPNWPTLGVVLADGSPMPEEGAEVDITAEPFKTMLDKEFIIIDPEAVPPSEPEPDAGQSENGGTPST